MDVSLRQYALAAAVKVLTQQPFDAIGRKYAGEIVPVFMLHRFRHPELSPHRGHRPEFVRQAIAYLRANRYSVIDIDDAVRAALAGARLPSRSVVFTMDDGFADQAEAGAKVFIEEQAPVSCFLISGMIDGYLWPWDDRVHYALAKTAKTALSLSCEAIRWELNWSAQPQLLNKVRGIVRNDLKKVAADQLEQYLQQLFSALEVDVPVQAPAEYRPMSWQQARTLEQQGVRFGAHTVTHRILSRLSDAEARKEIEVSQNRVCSELRNPVQVFCYPTGRAADFGSRDQQLLREYGYTGALSTEPGYLEPLGHGDDAFAIRRFSMPHTMPEFIQYCSWIEKVKERLRRR